ncbi:hypothetical protein [Methanosarcina sp. UBA289]|uniref:hypothetical protein n=1 Tax=Methanosarcina sp. UBA289 TaxID=1915574 RepID=UPI0025DB2515|nr:hypothetical protein [Methanosarcina sp. UBA289]
MTAFISQGSGVTDRCSFSGVAGIGVSDRSYHRAQHGTFHENARRKILNSPIKIDTSVSIPK